METQATPTIASFVIRFVVDKPPADPERPVYRGSIRHIQSNEEINFNLWQDAVDFIQRYVALETQAGQSERG